MILSAALAAPERLQREAGEPRSEGRCGDRDDPHAGGGGRDCDASEPEREG